MKSKLFFEILKQELNKRLKSETNSFKIKAFKNVINQINSFDTDVISDINTKNDLQSYNISGIGKGIQTIIQDILDDKIKKEELSIEENSINIFTNIMSIGIVKAKKLVQEKIYTIEDLNSAVKKNPKILNEKQKIGLKYYYDFNSRIPRSEMIVHDSIIGNIVNKMKKTSYSVVGSYRRGAESSGDIDVLVTSNNSDVLSKLIEELKKINYISDDFAHGETKYMGCCKVCEKYRRIDILYVPVDKYPYALLYFTGSKEHNIKVRKHALKLGYSLNEFGLKKNGVYIQNDVKTERDLFRFLELDYVEPTLR